MSTIKDFGGGLNIRPHPQLIAANQSTEYINCENEQGILKPTKKFTSSGISAQERWVRFNHCDRVISSSDEAYWAELGKYMYEATDNGITKEDCEGNKTNLGIEAPIDTPVIALAGPGNLCGVYKYVYTYYNSTEGIESAPSELSNQVDIATITTGGPTATPNLDEKQRFLTLGNKFNFVRNSDNSTKHKLEEAKCIVDHATGFTIPEFTAYINAQLATYSGGGNATVKYNKMMCKYDGTPAAHDVNASFFSIVQRVQAVLDDSDYTDSQKMDVIGCILDGASTAQDHYGGYQQIVTDLIDASNSSVPGGAYVTGDEWYLTQYSCIVSELPGTEDQEATTTTSCSGEINVTGMEASTDTQVTHIRLYRIGGTLTHYSLVVELPNISQSYLDNNSDDSIAGNHVLDSFANGTPPEHPKYLTEGNAMLFVSSDTKLYFSEVAKPYAWPKTNFLDFGQEITGMGMVQNGMLVFTRYKTYIVTGNNPSTLSRFLISGEQGCVNHDTIAFSDNRLYWLSTDGVCTSGGGNIEIITQGLMGRFNPSSSINADVFDRMYFLGYEDKTLILDSRYGYVIRELNYNGWYGDFNDELYLQKGGELKKMFSGDNDVMSYKSPIYVEGRLSEYKMFKDVYVAFRGDIRFNILSHDHDSQYGDSIYDYVLDPEHMQTDIKTRGNTMGYGISFHITGTGEVHEIDFKASGKENGK